MYMQKQLELKLNTSQTCNDKGKLVYIYYFRASVATKSINMQVFNYNTRKDLSVHI